MPTDIKQYMQELAKKAGLSPEQTSTVLEVLGNETIANGFVARSDYSRDLDKTRDETKAAEQKRFDEWYNREVKPAAEHNYRLATRYEERFGPLDESNSGGANTPPNGNGNGNGSGSPNPNGNYVTGEDLKRALDAQGAAATGLMKTLTRVGIDHYQRFGAPLDLDALEKFAVENNLRPDHAYEKFIAPKVSEIEQERHKKELEAAREEGRRDALSRVGASPVDAASREGHLIYDPFKPPANDTVSPERRSMNAFMDGWNEATGANAKP